MGGFGGGGWGGGQQKEGYEQDSLKNLERNRKAPTNLFLALVIKNKEFRNKYILRFCDYVN